MTNEELDRARSDEAYRIWLETKGREVVGVISARLAREGWTPFKPVDPDLAEAEHLTVDYRNSKFHPITSEWFLKAIKRGRELERAEAKSGLNWVKRGQQDVNPFDKSTLLLVIFISGQIDLRYSDVTALWSNITHYAVITPPEDVA